ncbi:MAG: hypothetical protein ACRC2T_18210 [Thermoguttaceae bacterium]
MNWNLPYFARLFIVFGSTGLLAQVCADSVNTNFYNEHLMSIQVMLLWWIFLLPLLISGLIMICEDRKAGIKEEGYFPNFKRAFIMILTNKNPASLECEDRTNRNIQESEQDMESKEKGAKENTTVKSEKSDEKRYRG